MTSTSWADTRPTTHRPQSLSIDAARQIAEKTHLRQLDATGAPYIAHVRRVAATVPPFARPVGWLHDVTERSDVDEEMLVGAGASAEQCQALRLLMRDPGELSDECYLEHIRTIALSSGTPGRMARAVKRADLFDHITRSDPGTEGWTPPHRAAFAVLMKLSVATAADAATRSH